MGRWWPPSASQPPERRHAAPMAMISSSAKSMSGKKGGLKVTPAGPTTIPEPLAVDGAWKLKPGSGRGAGAIVMCVVALFWNGVTWGITAGVLHDTNGVGRIFILLFMLIFIALGVLMAVIAVMMVMKALFTPVVELTLDVPRLVRGKPAALRWEVSRRAERLKDLHIALVLREECQYRRGTDTSTDACDVRELALADHDVPLSAGSCTVLVPEDLPPSFATKANQLVWMIRLRGTARGAPDIDDTFPLRVEVEGAPAASLVSTPLPVGTRLPEEGPVLVLAGADACPAPGHPLAGVVRAPGRAVSLRLRWQVNGKGDPEGGEAASVLLPADSAGFVMTLPATPPAFRGTMLSITWVLEAVVDGQIVSSHHFTAG